MKNKKWIKYSILTIIILAIIIATIVLLYKKLNNKTVSLEQKIKDEFEYLDSTTLTMINSLNNLYSPNLVEIQRTISNTTSQQSQLSTSGQSSQEGGSSSGEGSNSGDNSGSGTNSGQESESSDSQNTQTFILKNNSIILKDKNNVDWNELENQAEKLYTSWTTIALDLNAANVSANNILEYSSTLDNLLISIKNQDKTNSTICLANLYSLIPIYMEEIAAYGSETELEKVKSNIISAYSIVETDNWDSVNKFLAQAEVNLTSLISSSSSSKETKQAELNKSYVLLKELIKSSNEKNVDLFYLKYINLIDELENI